ncbi:MAG: arginine--tRNA ligase [bacterium]|nr:arginine--tRNA ligase [bacterium]
MKDKLIVQIKDAVKKHFGVDVEPEVSCPDSEFGDYTTNVAMKISKDLGMNPREIAEVLAEQLRDSSISNAEIAGPGFINLTLSDTALLGLLKADPVKPLAGKTVVAEYSDPNPFKVLHAGHLYTSLVGDAIARLLDNAGATVRRVNFGGDVGLHVGKAMWAILEKLGGEHPIKLDEIEESQRLVWVSERYVEGSTAYDEDEAVKLAIVEINKKVYKLHEDNDHETNFAQIYWICRQWSYDGFNALYERLGMVPFDKYYPESLTTPVGMKAVQASLDSGVLERSDGAVVFIGENSGLHTRVFMTSTGLPTYEAKDLGLAVSKWEDYHFDHSIMITGNDIIEYMKVVMAVLNRLNPEVAERTNHLTHGMIRLAGGAKMSSRKGSILRASDVLDAAARANHAATGKVQPRTVLGAVKYAFLKQRIGGDIIYDPAESVALEGNSGPYLQYAYARARSILSKASAPVSQITELENLGLQDGERLLARKLSQYDEIVELATVELMPHHICTFLYELAQEFNRFYEKNRVIDDPRQDMRLSLVHEYADKLKSGLSLLGIESPEQM